MPFDVFGLLPLELKGLVCEFLGNTSLENLTKVYPHDKEWITKHRREMLYFIDSGIKSQLIKDFLQDKLVTTNCEIPPCEGPLREMMFNIQSYKERRDVFCDEFFTRNKDRLKTVNILTFRDLGILRVAFNMQNFLQMNLKILHLCDIVLLPMINSWSFPLLRELQLQNCSIESLNTLPKAPLLRTLEFERCVVRNGIPYLNGIARFPNLRYVSYTHVSSRECYRNIHKLKKLELVKFISSTFDNVVLPRDGLKYLKIEFYGGMIVKDLYRLHDLETLKILNCSPFEVYHLDLMPKLKHLSIKNCNLETVPWLGHLPNLQILDLSHNSITRIMYTEQLVSLKELNMSHCKLGRIDNIYKIPSLEKLDMSHNNIYHTRELEDFPNLKSLKLSYCEIFRAGNLRKLEQLEEFEIDNNPITGRVLGLPKPRRYIRSLDDTLRTGGAFDDMRMFELLQSATEPPRRCCLLRVVASDSDIPIPEDLH